MFDCTWFIADESKMLALGANMAEVCPDTLLIFLSGTLGAGKTTLTRGFLWGLGYEGKVKSPTYTLVEPYDLPNRHVFHFDLYRLHDSEELAFMGFNDYLQPQAVCLVEWPEQGAGYLPTPDLACHIAYMKEGRIARIIAHTPSGGEVLKQLYEKLPPEN